MSTPHNEQDLGKPLRNKKKRSAVFIVIVASIAVHVLGGLGLAAVKIIEVLQPEPEFEAPPVVEVKPPPPPPPPPPTTKRSQRSLPRPQPLAVKNAQNTNVPAIEMNDANLTVGGGRGFGGGLGQLGGAVADSLRISFFGVESDIHDVVFVVDMSGSMVFDQRGAEGFRKVVDELVESLEGMERGGGTFNVIAFSGKVERFYQRGFTKVTEASITEARAWLMDRDPAQVLKDKNIKGKIVPKGVFKDYKGGRHGGTNADAALKEAFRLKPKLIFFISDGQPTGVKASDVLKSVEKLQPSPKVVINTLSYKSREGRDFLKELAKASEGTYSEVK